MSHREILLSSCVLVLFSLFPLPAKAILTDEETTALDRTYKIYQQTKSTNDLLERLRSGLDLQTLLFLREKVRLTKNQVLPKMIVHRSSRVSFKVKSRTYTVDFISLRSKLLAINGVEVEFLPDEKPEVRFQKLVHAFSRSTASTLPLLRFLNSAEEKANAKPPSRKPPPSLAIDPFASENDHFSRVVTQLSALITAITTSAKSQAECSQSNFDTLMARCHASYTFLVPDYSNPLVMTQTANREGKPPFDTLSLCPDLSRVSDLEPKDVLPISDGLFKMEQVKESRKNGDEVRLIKSMLQLLRDSMVQFKSRISLAELNQNPQCFNELHECVLTVYNKVINRLTEKDEPLICFTKKMMNDVSKLAQSQGPSGGLRPGAPAPK